MKALALLAGLWLAAAPPSSPAPAADEPAIGRFLVANRQVAGFFGESVVVLVDHGAHGSLGLIVNRPVELTLDELLPDVERARGHGEHAFLGGPVATDQLLLLIRAKQPPRGSAPVLDDLHVSGSRETLIELLGGSSAGVEFRAYVGYAGWAPGQLASEIARGDWTLAPGDAASVFARDPSGLWETLLRRHQEIQVQGPQRGPRSEPQANEVTTAGPLLARAAKSITLSAPWRSAAASSASPTSGRARSSTR
jgi:putative transcriptional regulator